MRKAFIMNSSSRYGYKNMAGELGNKLLNQTFVTDSINRYGVDGDRPNASTVLILSAGFGNGHHSVAHALKESLHIPRFKQRGLEFVTLSQGLNIGKTRTGKRMPIQNWITSGWQVHTIR